jgi:hypothetical protein
MKIGNPLRDRCSAGEANGMRTQPAPGTGSYNRPKTMAQTKATATYAAMRCNLAAIVMK